MSPWVVQQLLGHNSVKVTEGYVATKSRHLDAVQRLDALVLTPREGRDAIGHRLPCTRAELEGLRRVMFFYFAAAERDPNCLRGFLVTGYTVELAQLLAGKVGCSDGSVPGTGARRRSRSAGSGTAPGAGMGPDGGG